MELSLAQRLSRAQELATVVRDAGSAANARGRSLLQSRAAGIRDALLGRASAPINIFDPATAIPAVASRAEEIAAIADPRERVEAAQNLAIVGRYLAWSVKATEGAGEQSMVRAASEGSDRVARLGIPKDLREYRLAQFDRMKAAGADVGDSMVSAGFERGMTVEPFDRVILQATSNLRSLNEQFADRMKRMQKRMDDESAKGSANPERDAKDWADARAYLEAEMQRVAGPWKQKLAEATAEREAIVEKLAPVGRAVIAHMVESGGVGEDAAKAWAESQVITKPAIARLKKMGYPVDKVRSDMAEFYRLTGGRLSAVVIHSKGDRRANATNIHGHQASTINLDGDFTKRTLWHEMAHHIEAEPAMLAGAKGFLAKRGGAVRSLNDLTGSRGYRAGERAHEDGFFNPYVGKIYDDATEVFSMGLESFHDPAVLAGRMAVDPEMFEFVVGAIKTPAGKDFAAARAVLDQTAKAEAKVKAEEADDMASAIGRFGAMALRQGHEFSLEESALIAYEASYYKMTEYLGAIAKGDTVVHIWVAKSVRDPKTRRMKAGHRVGYFRHPDGGKASRLWFTGYSTVDGLAAAKAMAIAIVSGRSPIGISTSPDELRKLAAEVDAS